MGNKGGKKVFPPLFLDEKNKFFFFKNIQCLDVFGRIKLNIIYSFWLFLEELSLT